MTATAHEPRREDARDAPTGPTIRHLKPPVDPETLTWRTLRRDEFWRRIPAWRDVDEATFLDAMWQEKHAATSAKKLRATLEGVASEALLRDVEEGLHRAPMAVRVTPYILALIDWEDPWHDRLRRQFLPLASQLQPDHPMLTLDSLGEQADAPVPGLTHRYPDKALFLVLDTCPVYCRFCTRSYAVGTDTDEVDKVSYKATRKRWELAFRYLAERPEVEDVVISGGDAYRLKPRQLEEIGNRLLDLPNIRRFRYATKGPAIMPMKLLTDEAWVDALTRVVDRGRKLGKEVALHTHFNTTSELTGISQDAMQVLFERGITVRNQTVFQRGVNDDAEEMIELSKRLSHVNVHPYYVYMHDLVQGTEDLRTTLARGIQVEKRLRGTTAGFNTPTFVVDAPGGGGKRDIHSFEHYDRETGISVYSAPSVKQDRLFTYFDPLSELSIPMQQSWRDPTLRHQMVHDALSSARRGMI